MDQPIALSMSREYQNFKAVSKISLKSIEKISQCNICFDLITELSSDTLITLDKQTLQATEVL